MQPGHVYTNTGRTIQQGGTRDAAAVRCSTFGGRYVAGRNCGSCDLYVCLPAACRHAAGLDGF